MGVSNCAMEKYPWFLVFAELAVTLKMNYLQTLKFSYLNYKRRL